MVLKMPFSNALVPLHRLCDIWQSTFDEVLFYASRGTSEKNVLKEHGCGFFLQYCFSVLGLWEYYFEWTPPGPECNIPCLLLL